MTVADLISDLSKLPGYLPVAGVMDWREGQLRREVAHAEFQGRYVALVCDGRDPLNLR